jgi:hypothetical protein
MILRCAECQCTPNECTQNDIINSQCKNCTKKICCCTGIHQSSIQSINHLEKSRPAHFSAVQFLKYVKGLLAAAIGIEISCVGSAENG